MSRDDKMVPVLRLTDAGDSADEYRGYCPVCNEYLSDYDNFCASCGQALNWDTEEIEKKLGKSEKQLEREEKDKEESNMYLNFVNEFNGAIKRIIDIIQKYKEDIPHLVGFTNIDIQVKSETYDANWYTEYTADILGGDGGSTGISMDLKNGTGNVCMEEYKKVESYKVIKATNLMTDWEK